jgi:hypothetical protein
MSTEWAGNAEATAVLSRIPGIEPGARALQKGDLRVILARDPFNARWHLSISCADRYPTWDEICDARYALVPDNATMAMLLPPRSEYVNIHKNCFHLFEIDPVVVPTP